MSKYEQLWIYVSERNQQILKLSFDEIERVLGFPLDHSFLKYKKESENYGYAVVKISLKENFVTFKKAEK